MTEEMKRDLHRARIEKDEHSSAEIALELALRQVHAAMMMLRDNTNHISHPALIATVGAVQAKLGIVYAEIGGVRNEILDTLSEAELKMLHIQLGLPL